MEASLSLLTALVIFAAAIVGLITRLTRKVEESTSKVEEVHVMVNSRMEESINQNKLALKRINQLVDALQAAGIDIPDTLEANPNPK